jgi:hypothetical protein
MASWTDGLRVQGASQAQEVRNRKASPEESGEERRRKPKFQERFGRHRKDGSSQGHHPERETRQVKVKRKPSFNDNGDAEAGLRGRFQSGARRKPNAGGSRREGGFSGTQVLRDREPGGPQAVGSWQPQEVKAVRPEQSAEAQAKGRLPEGWGENQHEGQTKPQAQAGGDGGPKACQRAASERRRKGESQ